ncbi:MAG TPA: hypothetical protein VEA79_07560 [Phenylobacterium sp.]|nr:hypothetical protein [Phenylobacterium sp.]
MPIENTRRAVGVGVQSRAAKSTTYDPEARTVELVVATETPVRTPGWKIGIDTDYWEILECSRDAVDLSQVEAGNAPLLDTHDRFSLDGQLGRLRQARVENNQVIVLAALGESEKARTLEADIAADTAPSVSAGYVIQELILVRNPGGDELPVYRAKKWRLREATFCPIGADPLARVRSAEDTHQCFITEGAMPEANTASGENARNTNDDLEARIGVARLAEAEANAATARARQAAAEGDLERSRASGDSNGAADEGVDVGEGARSEDAMTPAIVIELQEQARSLGLDDDESVRTALTAPGATRAAVNTAILSAAAARQSAATSGVAAGEGARVGREASENQRDGMVEALAARMAGRAVEEIGRGFRGYSVLELWGQRMGISGLRDPLDIYERIRERSMNTTSDFPLLLENAANKNLLAAYQLQAPTYRSWAVRRSFNDFKPQSFLRVGDFPALLDLGEGGEIKAGTLNESKETAKLTTKGRLITLTRQVLINDDLGAMGDFAAGAGRQAARVENAMAYQVLLANGGAGPKLADGKNMFHTDHGNLAAVAAGVTEESLTAARKAGRLQKDLDNQPLNLDLPILLLGPNKESEAEKILAPITPVDSAKVNIFAGKKRIVSDAWISDNAWWTLADPAGGESNFVYGYLRDQEAPMIRQSTPFNYDGVSFATIHDFAVGGIDSRFGYRNAGA